MAVYKTESGAYTTSPPPLQRGEKWVRRKGQISGKIYYEKEKMTQAEMDKAAADAVAREERRRQADQEALEDQRARDREARRQRENPPPPPRAEFIPGQTRGIDFMRARLEETAKPVTDLFRLSGGVKVRVGPKIPGTKENEFGVSGHVGDADTSGRSVDVGSAKVTEKGVVKRGVTVSTPSSNLGQVSASGEVAVDAKESVEQGANRATGRVVDSEAGRRAVEYGQLDRVDQAVNQMVNPDGKP